MRKLFFVLLAVGLTWSGITEASQLSGKVKTLGLNKGFGNILFIELDQPKTRNTGAVTDAPSCQTNAWSYVLSISTDLDMGKEIMSMLVAARASGSTVTLAGTDDCGVFGSIETLKGLNY
ncbi:MAG: hypothetical protein AABY83_00725 [Pseudomonadota bacterium]